MKLRPYPEYKDSGIEWLGQIPSHWSVRTAARFTEQQNRAVREQDATVTAFRNGQVTLRSNRRLDGFTEALQEHGYQGVREGDLVIHSMDGFAGAIGVSDSDGKMSPVAHIYRTTECLPEFIALQLRVSAKAGFIESLAKGIRERSTSFDRASFRSMKFAFPSKQEQRQIVGFLDRETAEIDAFIGESERLVELLNERRTASITQAVTKGLNPDAPMKDSGIEWLGQVPEHWEMAPAWSVFRRKKELVGDAWANYQLLSLTRGGIIERDIESADGKFPERFDGYQIVEPGDFVFCLFDVEETPRTVGLSSKSGMITSAYTRFIVEREDVVLSFLELYFIALDNEKRLKPLYSGLRNVIQTSVFLQARIPVPPLPEQSEILEHLLAQIRSTDSAIATAREGIALARERRQALISAAVTGKIDVRSAL